MYSTICAILYINGPGKKRGTGTVAATFTVLSKEQYIRNTVMVSAFRYLFCTFQGTVPVHKEALLWLQSSGTCSGWPWCGTVPNLPTKWYLAQPSSRVISDSYRYFKNTNILSHLSTEGNLSQPSSRVISNNYRYFVSPLGWRVLVTSQLQGDFKVVGGQVVEVLHPTRYWVPDTKSQTEFKIQVDLVTVGVFQQARFY